MAINTYQTYLMYKSSAGAAYETLIDIKDFPDLGGAPEMLETTTLSDPMQTFIAGIQTLDTSGLQFTCNYTKADFTALQALEGTEVDYAIWFGATESGGSVTPDGSNGKFSFKGELSVHVNGGGVNEVVEMTVTIAPTTAIEFA